MDQVSSFLEGIMAADPNDPTSSTSLAGSKADSVVNNAVADRTSKNLSGEKWTGDIDFSSFWNYGKNTNDSGKPAISGPTPASGSSSSSKPTNSSMLTDKLIEKMISMIIPMNVEGESSDRVLSERIEMQKFRPPLSMNLMSINSVQFNQRLSVVFYTIDNVIMLMNWTNPTYTIGMLLVATHIILNPFLVSVLPVVLLMKNILVPHYLLVYAPDNTAVPEVFDYNPIPSSTALNDYKVPGPVPQLSREFIMNLTDLQNHMVPYVIAYDYFVWLTEDYLYYKNENITSIIFLASLALGFYNIVCFPKIFPYIIRNVLVLKILAIAAVWGFVILFHPSLRGTILEWIYNEDTRLNVLHITDKIEQKLMKALVNMEESSEYDKESEDNDADEREVEIFELQNFNRATNMWELVGFTDNFYTINVAARKHNSIIITKYNNLQVEDQDSTHENEILADLIKLSKKKALKDVLPPRNWRFSSSKWTMDLDARSWVEENLVEDLVMIDEDEKWVYDFREEVERTPQAKEAPSADGVSEMPATPVAEFYRRRRWVRACRREKLKEKNKTNQ